MSARVVSLAPSATATVQSLGAADRLVGVTTHCHADAPAVGTWLDPDFERVADADPNLLLTADPLQREVCEEARERGFAVAHHEPATLPEVFETVAAVGEAVGRPEAGAAVAAECRERVAAVREAAPTERPVVYCEEWGDPPTAAGNWVPEAVRAAGGRYPFVAAGERSRPVSGDDVADAGPDHVVVHHCGHGGHARPDFEGRGWDLDAAVHVVDDDLLNQPSPRLVEGIETLATLW